MERDQGSAPEAALFIDVENLLWSVRNTGLVDPPDVAWDRVVDVAKRHGRLAVKRAYGDWIRLGGLQEQFLALGVEVVHLPSKGKNAADLRIVLDAVRLVYEQPEVEAVVLASGDGDFVDLVHFLRAFGKRVVGIGLRATSAGHLIAACDAFFFYEDLVGDEVLRDAGPPNDQTLHTVEHYLDLIRERSKIRMAPSVHRPEVILTFFRLYQELAEKRPSFSLTELKNYVHQWFQEHRPEVPQTVVNDVTYQLFHTYSFEFDSEAGERGALWDRPVRFRPTIRSAADLLNHCDQALLRFLADKLGGPERVAPGVAAEVLYGQDTPPLRQRVEQLLKQLPFG